MKMTRRLRTALRMWRDDSEDENDSRVRDDSPHQEEQTGPPPLSPPARTSTSAVRPSISSIDLAKRQDGGSPTSSNRRSPNLLKRDVENTGNTNRSSIAKRTRH